MRHLEAVVTQDALPPKPQPADEMDEAFGVIFIGEPGPVPRQKKKSIGKTVRGFEGFRPRASFWGLEASTSRVWA